MKDIDVESIKAGHALEKNLLQVMSRRDTFEYYRKYVDKMTLISTTSLLMKDYAKYYDTYPEHSSIDFDVFLTHFASEWHTVNLSLEEMGFYCDNVIPKLKETPVDDYESCLLGLMGRDALDRINSAEFKLERVQDVLKDYEDKRSSIVKSIDPDLFDIHELDFSLVDPSKGLTHALPGLQEHLGGYIPGQFVIVAAPSGAGKSAFCLTQAAHTFKEIHEKGNMGPVLYFNSEGRQDTMIGRFMSNLYHEKLPKGYKDVVANQEKIMAHYHANYDASKFLTFPIKGRDVGYVKSKIARYKPSLVIIDILDGMRKSAILSEAGGFEDLYQDLREVSTLCPIIGTSQTSDSAKMYDKSTGGKTPKRWLTDTDLHQSNIGKQGAADTIIMIGMDDKDLQPRYVTVAKDKVGEGSCRVECNLIHKYSMYEEI